MFHTLSSNKDFAGKSLQPPPPPGLIILGGQSKYEQLASIETFGFEDCTIPQLPETRYGLGSFVTPTEYKKLAVCGGWWEGKPHSTDCLTLNTTNGQWERGTFTNGLLGEGVRGVIDMKEQGIYVVHSRTISKLPPNSAIWSAGPVFPTSLMSSAECGCKLTENTFVTIHTNEGRNVREYSTTDQDWKSETLWPSTTTKRWSPGCGATGYHLVVAGGVSSWDEVLSSVEVFVIESKALKRGGNMKRSRAFFNIIPVGTAQLRLLAIGGRDGRSILKSSEWWEEEDNQWGEGFSLSMGRSSFGVVLAPASLACTQIEPPPHSCPVNNGQSCVFSTEAGDIVVFSCPGSYTNVVRPLVISEWVTGTKQDMLGLLIINEGL